MRPDRTRLSRLLALVAAGLVTGAGGMAARAQTPAPDAVVATVDGIKITEREIAIAAEDLAGEVGLLLHLRPAFRLLETGPDHEGQERRQRPDDELPPPRLPAGKLARVAEDLQFPQADADRRGEEVPHGGEGLKQPEGVRPGPVGHHLGHEGHTDGKLSADAEPRDEPVKAKSQNPVESAESPVHNE